MNATNTEVLDAITATPAYRIAPIDHAGNVIDGSELIAYTVDELGDIVTHYKETGRNLRIIDPRGRVMFAMAPAPQRVPFVGDETAAALVEAANENGLDVDLTQFKDTADRMLIRRGGFAVVTYEGGEITYQGARLDLDTARQVIHKLGKGSDFRDIAIALRRPL